jgi:lycopene cyclase domain-containing protein
MAETFGHFTYLVLLLPWVAPVILLHWWIGTDILIARWRQVVFPTVIGGTYLSLADRFALGVGIWDITAATSTGLKIGGLPIEELLFFFLTALMVSQSITLMTAPELTVRDLPARFRSPFRRPRVVQEQ